MKKFLSILLIFVLLFGVVACNADDTPESDVPSQNEEEETKAPVCQHEWTDATCTAKKTCKLCGETDDEALGHTWADATCTAAKTCSVCGATEGEALGHAWVDATCTAPKTCSTCGETEGEALGHDLKDATCTEPASCQREGCDHTEGEIPGHVWSDATCTTPKTCSTCGETEGDPLDHDMAPATCTAPATCKRGCGHTEGEKLSHDMAPATCAAPATCKRGCGYTEGEALPHTWVNATLTAPKTCSVCQAMTLKYDDYFPTLLSIPASKEGLSIEGTALGITTVGSEKYFQAKGIGTATLIDGEQRYSVTVEKAKINIIVVMGQSNSVNWEDSVSGSNLFQNAMTDVSSPLGTAYIWNNTTKKPEKFTATTRGIHSTLLAELYAQSVAAGDPVKNILIWKEGSTSRSGMSISFWATPNEVLTPTLHTAKFLENCLAYYTKATNARKYSIESKGMYWLQGEIDGSTNAHNAIPGHTAMDPATYEASFMKMWSTLKAAGLEYVAFLRVRRDVEDNKFPNADAPDHNDLTYTTALSAQLKMIAENEEFYLATSLTEHWVGTEDTEHTIDISKYGSVMNEYSNGESILDKDGNVIATVADGKLTTTMKDIYGSIAHCHYGKFGYTLIAADAAYNMYRALYGNNFAIVQGDTSGTPATQTTATAGDTKTIDVSTMTEDLVFRADAASTAGTLSITVMNGETDITDAVTITEGAHLGALNVETLRTYDNVKVTVTYTPTNGTAGSVTYTIVK